MEYKTATWFAVGVLASAQLVAMQPAGAAEERPGSPTFRAKAVSVACPDSRTTAIQVGRIRAVGYDASDGQRAQIRYRLVNSKPARWRKSASASDTLSGYYSGIKRGRVKVKARVSNASGWGRWSRVKKVRISRGNTNRYCGS